MRVIVFLISLIALSWSAISHAELYAAAGNSDTNLYIISTTDGAVVSVVGDTGELLTGLAFSPLSGELYGTTTPSSLNPNSLVRIDPDSGSTTVIGSHAGPVVDISFAPDGTLFGWSESGDDPVTIDLTTGATTVLGPQTYGSAGAALDFSNDGRLWRFGKSPGVNSCEVQAWDKNGYYIATTATLADCDSITAGSHDADGNLFVITGGGGGAGSIKTLAILNKNSGDVIPLGETITDGSALAWRSEALGYATITPCRVFDTRATSPFSPGETRGFYVWGVCEIPKKAEAVAINFTTINPALRGYLRAWASGDPEPTATLMTWPDTVSISNSTTVPINNDFGNDMDVKIYDSTTHLVGDAVGYFYRKPR